jgi:ABC-type multidrug transport system fused ATPase/permease subunit
MAASVAGALPTDHFQGVMLVMLGIGLLTVFGATANFLHQWGSMTLVTRVTTAVRLECFRHVIHLPLGVVVRARSGGTHLAREQGFGRAAARLPGTHQQGACSGHQRQSLHLPRAVWFDWRLTLSQSRWRRRWRSSCAASGTRIRRGTRGALKAQEDLLRASNECVQGMRAIKTATPNGGALALRSREPPRDARGARGADARAASGPLVETLAVFALIILALVAAKQIIAGSLALESFLLALGALAVAAARSSR